MNSRNMILRLMALGIVLLSATSYAKKPVIKDQNVVSHDTLKALAKIMKCSNKQQQQVSRHRGEYQCMENFVMAEHGPIACHESVTFTTHADYTFLDNVPNVVANWIAPVSVAVYAPGTDLQAAVDSIRYLRDCSGTPLIKKYVSFHLFFPSEHRPKKIPTTDAVKKPFNCNNPPPYKSNKSTYKKLNKLLYPINIARNIAIEAALTHYVLPADIELYPSLHLVPQFLNMISRNKPPLNKPTPRVFPLNIMDVFVKKEFPSDKDALLDLYNAGKASPFRGTRCKFCHLTPKRDKWLTTKETSSLEVFAVTKRVGEVARWEPTFLATKDVVHFDERLTWEGMMDKMTLAYQYCLQDYDFMVLNNAFLIHKPGEKTPLPNKERRRIIEATNSMIAKELISEYEVLFGKRKGCMLFNELMRNYWVRHPRNYKDYF